jgi:predicted nucleotidyltransferase
MLERSLRALRDRETWLRQGVAHAAIFGSVARGDDDENSDGPRFLKWRSTT